MLAKSPRDGREFLLVSHLFETGQAARRVFRLNKRWGKNWCRFFGLTTREAQKRFLLNLYVAAVLHDLGKANEDFYKAVTTPGFIQQTIRHEHLSALILHLQNVRQWLTKNRLLDVEVITAAVLSHHLKAQEGAGKWLWCQAHGKNHVKLALQDEDVRAVFEKIRRIAHLEGLPELPREEWTNSSPLWKAALIEGGNCAFDFELEVERDPERQRLLLAVKAGLIVADSVSSGLVREKYDINRWIDEKVHSPAISDREIADKIIEKRKQYITKVKNRPFIFHKYQERAAELSSRALLLASCGSGKTMAAWKWAEAQARIHSIGKVIFLYPTRGTATEGFRDYVGWAPEAEAALVTGTSDYELEAMKENPPDERHEATRDKNYLTQEDERLFALRWWSRRFFSATVDQFLGFMEHSYSSLCLLPVLADSVLIVDEVHSYDFKMFEALINFLRTFNLPVLCMTATLTPKRIEELEELRFQKYPKPEDDEELSDLRDAEKHPRYHLNPITSKEEAFAIALAAYYAGKRVLWVVNVVDRCQELAQRLAESHKIGALCYHSRFTLEDRKQVHDSTVGAFQQTDKEAIAITTQVCEMSLDLDADVLVSEVAPPSSLVQRFGRANRHLDDKPLGFRAELYIYSTDKPAPYTPEEIRAGDAFLTELGSGEMSQRTLAEVLEHHAPDEPLASKLSRFLDSGYYAIPGAFRDGEERTKPCILDRDLETVGACVTAKKPYDAYILNVPLSSKRWRSAEEGESWLPKYLGIARSEFYSARYGFLREKKEKK
ncbi:MAG: cas3 [Acidobacteria bacterium]|nr:cas3 [Acidobacteriota bacterium]